VLLLLTNFLTYRVSTKGISERSDKVIEELNNLAKIDFDYINSLNALFQKTLEWGRVQNEYNAKLAGGGVTGEESTIFKANSETLIKEIDELTKLVLTFKESRENYINQASYVPEK